MLFTVCTATYNRAHTLNRVFNSLTSQSLTDFEWIVIDDGSNDGTDAMIAAWKKTATFPITYRYQENRGKHVAVNLGAKLAQGDFFIIADSDDAFLPNALEVMYASWLAIPQVDRKGFTGVTGLCIDIGGQIIGDKFPKDVFDASSLDVFYRHNVSGEKWGFHRTDVIRQFPSPEIKGVPFYGEGLIWHRIARKYKTRFINKGLRIYSRDGSDQLTRRSPIDTSPGRIFYVATLNDDHDYMFVAPTRFLKIAAQGVRFSLHQKDDIKIQFSRLNFTKLRLLWLLALPIGSLLYLRDIIVESRSRQNV